MSRAGAHRLWSCSCPRQAGADVAQHDPLYVAARTVLLDALEALGSQRRAIVVVGAQAVYLRTGDAGIAVAPYTTDADVALSPQLLAGLPADRTGHDRRRLPAGKRSGRVAEDRRCRWSGGRRSRRHHGANGLRAAGRAARCASAPARQDGGAEGPCQSLQSHRGCCCRPRATLGSCSLRLLRVRWVLTTPGPRWRFF